MSNYVQVAIGPLKKNADGKEIALSNLRGWKVTQQTIEIWSTLTDWANGFNSTSTYAVIYGGLIANCTVKREEPDFTFEDVVEWVDELNFTDEGVKTISTIKDAFEKSQHYINVLDKLRVQLSDIKQGVAKKKIVKKSVKKK